MFRRLRDPGQLRGPYFRRPQLALCRVQGHGHKLYVCWWGGSSYLNGSFTAVDCFADVIVDTVRGFVWYSGV